MIAGMALATTVISDIILKQLAGGDRQLLVLTVAVRKAMGRSAKITGDLPETVKSTLRKLVAAKEVVDVEGVYSLSPRK
jgi:hypothetical protein